MRKMILMAIAGYLWKKYKAHNNQANDHAKAAGAAGNRPAATAATAAPSSRP